MNSIKTGLSFGDKSSESLNPGRPIWIDSSWGALSGMLHLPNLIPAPVVVCCHGLLSSKASLKYIQLGQVLSRAGIAVLRFDFSGCGESRASLEPCLLSSRVRDIHTILDYVRHQAWCRGPIGLFGSSLGGFLALLAAGDAEFSVEAVVTWATPFDLDNLLLSSDAIESMRKVLPPGLELGDSKDLRNMQGLSHVLMIQGQQDEIVPWKHSLEIYQRMKEPKQLFLMRTADHRFTAEECRMLALEITCDWFNHFLQPIGSK